MWESTTRNAWRSWSEAGGTIVGQEWSQQTTVDFGIEDGDVDAVGGEHIRIRMGPRRIRPLRLRRRNRRSSATSRTGGEKARYLGAKAPVGEPVMALRVMHKRRPGPSCAHTRSARLRFVGPPQGRAVRPAQRARSKRHSPGRQLNSADDHWQREPWPGTQADSARALAAQIGGRVADGPMRRRGLPCYSEFGITRIMPSDGLCRTPGGRRRLSVQL